MERYHSQPRSSQNTYAAPKLAFKNHKTNVSEPIRDFSNLISGAFITSRMTDEEATEYIAANIVDEITAVMTRNGTMRRKKQCIQVIR